MIVVDASVTAAALLGAPRIGPLAADRLVGEPVLHAPHLLDLEFANAVRRTVRRELVSPDGAQLAFAELRALPLVRWEHTLLLGRVWELHENVSAYDAAYAALAESLDLPLVTADARLAAAPGIRCEVELIA